MFRHWGHLQERPFLAVVGEGTKWTNQPFTASRKTLSFMEFHLFPRERRVSFRAVTQGFSTRRGRVFLSRQGLLFSWRGQWFFILPKGGCHVPQIHQLGHQRTLRSIIANHCSWFKSTNCVKEIAGMSVMFFFFSVSVSKSSSAVAALKGGYLVLHSSGQLILSLLT